MNKNDYIIRLEREEEYREVENLVREALLVCVSSGLLRTLCAESIKKR